MSINEIPLIVMVDDRTSDLEINQFALEKIVPDAIIKGFLCGKEVLNYLKQEKEKGRIPDLILVDLQMPTMSGLEVIHEIKTQLQINSPTIAFSSSSLPENAIQAKKNGAEDFFVKPLTFKKNIDCFSLILKRYMSKVAPKQNISPAT
ncbi:MAG: response regulator [Bacteroidota bacterium]